MGHQDKLMAPPEAAEFLGFTVRFLEQKRYQGGGPPFYRISNRVRYSRVELQGWLSERRFTSTSDEVEGAKGSPVEGSLDMPMGSLPAEGTP